MFFTPVELGGKILPDGGLLNPVPIAPTFIDKPDITIAVILGGEPDLKLEKQKVDHHIEFNEFEKYHEMIRGFLSGFQVSNDTPQQKDRDLLGSASLSFETMQGTCAY